MERQLPLCTASTPARDKRLDDAQDGYGSPRTMHAAGVALRHAVGRPPTAPRHASRGFKEFLFSVGPPGREREGRYYNGKGIMTSRTNPASQTQLRVFIRSRT